MRSITISTRNATQHHMENASEDTWEGSPGTTLTMSGHEGMVACLRFMSPGTLLSASCDANIFEWDVERGKWKARFRAPNYDFNTDEYMSVAPSHTTSHVFASGGVDGKVKLWDVRDPSRPTHVYHGHEQDIDDVAWMPNGFTIGTASNDGTSRLFDSRAPGCEMARFGAVDGSSRCSLDFSKSGRLLFNLGEQGEGQEDDSLLAWDTLGGPSTPPAWRGELSHQPLQGSVGVQCEGRALAATALRTTTGGYQVWS